MASVSTDRRFGVNSGKAVKVACKVASTANLTLSGEQTIDGVACVTDDRVLVKNQTDTTENGIWIVDTGAWARSSDFDDIFDVNESSLIFVSRGTTNATKMFRVVTTGEITPGTTAITFDSTIFVEVGDATITLAKLDADLTTLVTGNVHVAATRTAMKALDTKDITVAYLDEDERAGVFTWDSTVAIADHQADTQEGIYVAPNAAAIGAWKRDQVHTNRYDIRWFGATLGADVLTALQAAIDMAEYKYSGQTIAWQNSLAATEVYIPAGYWELSAVVTITQGGIHIKGAGRGATTVYVTGTTGGFRFRHADYLDGQNINNNAITDMHLHGSANAITATDVGVSATLTKHFRVQDIRFTNFSYMLDLIAVEEPVMVTNNEFWQDNSNFVNTAISVRILQLQVNASTPGAVIDPDTSNEYLYPSMIFMDNNEFRAASGYAKSHILVRGVDGFYMNNCHMLGGQWQMQFNPISSVVPIGNFVVSDTMFDGIAGDTDRNIYALNKTFTTEMGSFILTFANCKINDADIENILLDHEDLEEFNLLGGVVDKATGNYMINAQEGQRHLEIVGVRFRLGTGGPDLGTILLDARNTDFFNVVRVKSCLFLHDDSATALPARHVQIESDGSNEPQIKLTENEYATSAALTAGFMDDNSSPALATAPLDRNNVSFTY